MSYFKEGIQACAQLAIQSQVQLRNLEHLKGSAQILFVNLELRLPLCLPELRQRRAESAK